MGMCSGNRFCRCLEQLTCKQDRNRGLRRGYIVRRLRFLLPSDFCIRQTIGFQSKAKIVKTSFNSRWVYRILGPLLIPTQEKLWLVASLVC